MELYQILIIICIVVVFALYIVRRIYGIDILQKIMVTRPVILALASAVQALSKLWENETLRVVYTVLRAGAEGAQMAEDAWLIGELAKEDRNAYAKQVARKFIAKAGIEVTDKIEMIISGIIEAVCILLPHGVTPESEG